MNWKVFAIAGFFLIAVAAYYIWLGPQSETPTSATSASSSSLSKDAANADSPASQTSTDSPPSSLNDDPLAAKNKSEIKSEFEFIKKYPGNWIFKRIEKGRLNYITGGNVPNLGRSPAAIKNFVQEIAPLLEIPATQLTDPKEINHTDLTRVYHTNQITDGYPVYQSVLSVHVRESDNSIFMVNNQLKDVAGYNKELRYNRNQAETYIQSNYAGDFEKIVFKSGPVIFKSETVAPELAWVFIMTYKQPKFEQVELVIGAYSGEEIHRQPVNVQ